MKRPIAISLSPNTEPDDILLALRILFSPWKWFDSKEVRRLEEIFSGRFGKKYKAISMNSGRSALYIILKALGIGKGDEVAIQAFTCVAVPNAILWLGAKPLYIDIDDSYNVDSRDLLKKITLKTKAIIVQNTFGVPADLETIRKIAKERKIFLIEDCAHSLGAEYHGEKIGTLSDVAFFSFGRDKIISSVFGGVIFSSNRIFLKKAGKLLKEIGFPRTSWTLQQVFHPVAMGIIMPFYNLGLGKLLLLLFQKLRLLSKAVYEEEKSGGKPSHFPKRLPGALAILALNQLGKLDRFNTHRKSVARYYFNMLKNSTFKLPDFSKGAVWLRFPIKTSFSEDLLSFTKSYSILLGDWYKSPVTPAPDLEKEEYKKGSCPNAEEAASQVVNLPTYPTLTISDAKLIIRKIKEWQKLR